jgi:hypothetical protein
VDNFQSEDEMVNDSVEIWAITKLEKLLPLDHESLQQAVEHALSINSQRETRTHFESLLGDSRESVSFIDQFVNKKFVLPVEKAAPQKAALET